MSEVVKNEVGEYQNKRKPIYINREKPLQRNQDLD